MPQIVRTSASVADQQRRSNADRQLRNDRKNTRCPSKQETVVSPPRTAALPHPRCRWEWSDVHRTRALTATVGMEFDLCTMTSRTEQVLPRRWCCRRPGFASATARNDASQPPKSQRIHVALHPTGRRGIRAALVNLLRRGADQLAQVGVPVQPTAAAREFAGLQHADCHPAAGVQQASIRGD